MYGHASQLFVFYLERLVTYTLDAQSTGNNFPGIASQFAMHLLYDNFTRYLLCSSLPS